MTFALGNKSPFYHILTGFGYLQLLIAAIAFVFAAAFVLRSDSANGVIVAFQQSPKTAKAKTPQSNPPLAPVIEFTPAGGKPVRIVGSFYERAPTGAVGDVVPVRYHPGAPDYAVVDVFADKWAFPLLFTVFGIALILGARLLDRRTT